MRVKKTGHDVASVLSATAMAVIAMGIVVGYQFTALRSNLQSRFSDASDQCRYSAVAEVHKDVQGSIFTTEELGELEILNNRKQLQVLNEGGNARASYIKDDMVFDPKGRTGYAENDKASVTLKKLNTKVWKIKGIFCDQKPGSVRGCASDAEIDRFNREIESGSRNGFIVPEFRVNCNVDLVYGWVLTRRADAPRPTVTARPTATPRLSVTPRPTTTGRPTFTPRPTSTPRPTVTPRGELTPRPSSTPRPTVTARPTATPRITQPGGNPPIGGPGNGRGGLEVQVVALNYPQRTPLWPDDHVASHRPASCKRQGQGEDPRPLYLNPFEIRATCINGGCREGRQTTVSVDKNKGYANLTDLDPGNYKIDIRSLGKGYHEWPGCKATWQVTANQINQQPVLILENEIKGTYELRTTEKLCKDAGGVPHIIEGLGGNSCYFAEGKSPRPVPTDSQNPQPTQSSGQICKSVDQSCEDHYREKCYVGNQEGSKLCHKFGKCYALGDGTKCTWGSGSFCESCVPKNGIVPTTPIGGQARVAVNIRTDSDAIKKVVVQLEPCPQGSPCTQEATFVRKGIKQVQFNLLQTDVRYKVKIADRNILYAQALEGVRVRSERCAGVIERVDPDYEMCIIKAPSFAQFIISEIKSQNPPPAPQPPAQPPRQSPCGYYLKPGSSPRCFVACPDDPHAKYCSPDYLRPYFGEFGEEVLRQAAGTCWNESRGYIQATNDRCFKTGRAWSHDFSFGLFQINQIGVCVQSIGSARSGGPSCARIPGKDPYACIDEIGLRTFDGNLRVAKDYYVRRKWQPWNYQCVN